MRFTLEIPNEPPQQFATRRAGLNYIKQRGTPAGAILTDNQTGTVMRFQPNKKNLHPPCTFETG